MPEDWLTRAVAAAGSRDWAQAEAHLKPYLEPCLEHPAALHLLGLIRRAQGRLNEAVSDLELALKRGGLAEIWIELGALHHELGQLETARLAYEHYQQLGHTLADPDLHRYAHCLRAAGAEAEALRLYRQLLSRHPEHAALWMHCGNALMALGEREEARLAYLHSLKLNPQDGLTCFNLAHCLSATGQLEAAESALRQSLELAPQLAPGWNLLGSLLQRRKQFEAAREAFEKAIRLSPDDPLILNNLGSCLQALYQGEAAAAAFKAALDLQPELWEARYNLAQLQRECSQAEAAVQMLTPLLQKQASLRYQQAFVLPIIYRDTEHLLNWQSRFQQALDQLEAEAISLQDPLREVGRLPFYVPYLGIEDRPVLEQLARVFLQACPTLNWRAPHASRPCQRAGKPRIGLVSGFFHNHTVFHLFGYLLRCLNHNKLQVFAIYTGTQLDSCTQMASSWADHFLRLPQDLASAREQVAGLECDLLLYLDIGMDPLGYFLAFARLAPQQMMTWGHPISSGLPSLDYFLSSPGLDLADGQRHYSETLLQAPHFFADWHAPEAITADPADFDLPAGRRYLCPQSLYKFNPDFDQLLIDLQRADPEGWLILLDGNYPDWKALLLNRWRGRLNLERIRWMPRMSTRDFVRLLDCGHVMLDTRPFGGGLTMMQALAQGVPVVTWPAEQLKGRVTYGLCRELDWDAGICQSHQAYVETAVKLAQAWSPKLKSELAMRYKDAIRPDMMGSQLTEMLLSLIEAQNES